MTFSRHPVRIGRLRAFHFRHDAISSFVAERIKDEGETADKALDAALAGFLQGFEVVIIQLDENDDAQEIFASLNGLGKPLAPFDLIRNDAERPTMSVFRAPVILSRRSVMPSTIKAARSRRVRGGLAPMRRLS
jgi:hypothetical protein